MLGNINTFKRALEITFSDKNADIQDEKSFEKNESDFVRVVDFNSDSKENIKVSTKSQCSDSSTGKCSSRLSCALNIG